MKSQEAPSKQPVVTFTRKGKSGEGDSAAPAAVHNMTQQGGRSHLDPNRPNSVLHWLAGSLSLQAPYICFPETPPEHQPARTSAGHIMPGTRPLNQAGAA